jgi:pimeloyl-ACP methyl ester carboxylesterase
VSDLPDLPGVRHEYVDAGALSMHVALAGPAEAPPVLLVHGWPQSWWAWRKVIPLLAERFRVVAPDLRGHGWSEAPLDGYEKEQLASDLLALLDALGIERASWVGHDWGGWCGILAALRAPERVDRLLALCIPHPWATPDPRRLALLSYQLPLSLPLLGRRAAGPMIRAILQAGRSGERLGASDVELFAAHIPPWVSVAMYRTFLMRELIPAARGRYGEAVLSVPTTVMTGAEDLVTRGAEAGGVVGQPQLTIEVLEGVAHWVPEQRARAILDWAER